MRKEDVVLSFEALSSGTRLDVFRLLVSAGHVGVVAGDIATRLDLAPSRLSFHLKALTQAGLLHVEQEGRFLRYRANLQAMRDLIGFLTDNCCDGQPEQCADVLPVVACSPGSCA